MIHVVLACYACSDSRKLDIVLVLVLSKVVFRDSLIGSHSSRHCSNFKFTFEFYILFAVSNQFPLTATLSSTLFVLQVGRMSDQMPIDL